MERNGRALVPSRFEDVCLRNTSITIRLACGVHFCTHPPSVAMSGRRMYQWSREEAKVARHSVGAVDTGCSSPTTTASMSYHRRGLRLFIVSKSCRFNSSSSNTHRLTGSRASCKLFADAEAEEAAGQPTPSRASQLLNQQTEENWDGDERIEDTVLRMLVDKYKPLRTNAIRSADEKLKDAPPSVSATSLPSSDMSDVQFRAALRSTESSSQDMDDHKPWLVTFKAPSHTSSIKLGRMPPPISTSSFSKSLDDPSLEGSKKPEPAARRRSETAQRLGRARESMIDYKMGVKGSGGYNQRRPAMPVSIRGLGGLVEERIEVRYLSY